MKKFFMLAVLMWSGVAPATTYYVSSSAGGDANSGTSVGSAWKTLAKVNGQTFQAGDSILLKRGDVWNESLVPPSSGASGNPITFDAYGMGAPPNLTGYYAVPSSAWVQVTGNDWKAPVPANYSTINFCLFGSVWGQKVGAASSNLKGQWDFYFANGFLYVYSVGNPASAYGTAIVPMALSNVPVINVNGKSWLAFQHLLVNWFDQYGVYVQGTSDHLVFANMEADSMIPQGAQPLGFYVNESAPGPGDIKIYNSESHMNYDAYRFDGAATAIAMVNDKAYGNRDAALVDNTGAVNYSYCHFYASSLAVAGSTDVLSTSGPGPTAGAGNIAADTAPAVQAWQRYPAQVTLTVDDAGMTVGTDTYYASTVLPIANAAGVPVGVAITVGYPLAQTLIPEFQGWVNAGLDVTAHSISHTYYTNTDAIDIQYTGTGSAAVLNISNQTLTITVTGAADTVSYSLARGQATGTIAGLDAALTATGHFTVSENPVCQGPYGTGCSYYTKTALLSQDLADVSSQDVKSGIYRVQLDVTRLTTDEITLSRQWMATNLTGLPATPVYVYPGGYETPTMQGITAGVPYTGARGALKEDLGVKDTYATGFDVQNVTSFGVNPSWQGLQPAALNQKVQALVWKQMVWGVPWGIFWHLSELSPTEIANLIGDLQSVGATIQTNTGLVNWLTTGMLETGTDGNFYYKSSAASMTLDFRPTVSSPVVDAGQNLGAAYQIDINGLSQNSYGNGWEIGAHAFAAYSSYGQANASSGTHFAIGPVTQQAGTAPVYYSTTATTNPGAVQAIFSAGSPVNSTAYDTSYNAPPLDCYTRVSDGTTFGGASVGDNTYSGGSNDVMSSVSGKYWGLTGSGGYTYILHLNLAGNCGQIVNTGSLTGAKGIHVPGPFGFSKVTDNVFYNVQNNSQVYSNVITSDQTYTPTLLVDVSNGTTCPGLPSGAPSSGGIFGIKYDDSRFGWTLGFGGGQDSAVWGVVYDRALGCAVVNTGAYDASNNPLGGKYWDFCPGHIAGPCTPTTAPSGTLASSAACTSGTDCSCWGGTTHDAQMSGDGTVLSFSQYVSAGSWTQGACIGSSIAAQRSDWLVGTATTQWCHGTGGALGGHYCDGHPSYGIGHEAGGDNGVFAIRSLTNDLVYTQFGTIPGAGSEAHSAWPHPNNDDTYPLIYASSDLPATGHGTNYAPTYLGNAMYAVYPGAVNQAITVFGHTFNCNPTYSLWAQCQGADWTPNTTYTLHQIITPTSGNAGNYTYQVTTAGASDATEPAAWNQTMGGSTTDGAITWKNVGAGVGDYYFGCTDGIIAVSQDGNWVMLASGMFLGLGMDSSNQFRCDAFLVHIGAARM